MPATKYDPSKSWFEYGVSAILEPWMLIAPPSRRVGRRAGQWRIQQKEFGMASQIYISKHRSTTQLAVPICSANRGLAHSLPGRARASYVSVACIQCTATSSSQLESPGSGGPGETTRGPASPPKTSMLHWWTGMRWLRATHSLPGHPTLPSHQLPYLPRLHGQAAQVRRRHRPTPSRCLSPRHNRCCCCSWMRR